MAGRREVAFVLALLAAGCGSFPGLGEVESGGYAPADSVIAVSADRIVQAVNVRTRIWARAGLTLLADFKTSDLFGGRMCGDNLAEGLSGPRVRFDEASGRWFVLAAETATPGRWCLAVSQTSVPERGWWLYAFQPAPAWFEYPGSDQPTFPDYPGLGIGSDTVLLTGNLAHGVYGLASVEHSAVLLLNKRDLLEGRAVSTAYFHPARSTQKLWLLQPSHHYGPGAAQIAAGVNVLTTQGTTLRVQLLFGVPGDPFPPTMYYEEISPDPNVPFRSPPEARQPGPGTIAVNDQRVLDVAYRAGQFWIALHQGCYPPNDVDAAGTPVKRACARYLQIDPQRIALVQDVRLRERRQYYYFPAIAIDNQGNLLSSVNRSSEDEFVSVYLTGRRPTDAPGTLRAPRLLKAGTVGYQDARGRWGDYGGAAADPVATGAWFSNPYADGPTEWRTWNGAVHAVEYPR